MNTRRWLITLALCVVVIAALAGYKAMQIREAIAFGESFPEPSETVEAVLAESALVQNYTTTIGEIVAPQAIDLRNELPGRVTAVNFASGASVKQGDILLQFDIAEEQAQLQAAQARAELARLDLQRIEALKNSNTVSQERFDQARAQYDIATAEVFTLKALIDKKNLRAPFDARVGIHQFEQGDFLQSNTLITTLVGINDYTWVDFRLPSQQAAIALGTEVQVTASTHPKQPMVARIIAMDSIASAQSRNVRFRARLENPFAIAPNAAVNVAIPVGEPAMRTRAPITAVRRDGLGDYVFVLEPEQAAAGEGGAVEGSYRARRQSVTIGPEDGHTVAIMAGLEPGQLIAANGAFKLRNQLLVHIKQRDQRGREAGPPQS